MSQAALGNTVKVHYTGTLDDGSQFDSSRGRDPLTVIIGKGELIPGFEQALVGMAEGESKSVTIASDDAYGPHRNELVQEVARAQIPPEMELEVGGAVMVRGPDGQPMRLLIRELTEDSVTLDANHPLAGEDLTFELELVQIV